MAIGKNKKLGKKKGSKKKQADPFSKKDWYDVKVPAIFRNRVAGKTPVRKSGGTKKDGTPYIATEAMKGRVFEINLGDLHAQSEETSFRKMRLIVEEVKGKDALCNFYGMDFTRDKLMGLMRKWQTTIEGNVDVKTDDGYLVRMFCIGFTNRQEEQVAKTTYAQASQVRAIRKKMIEVMGDEGKKSSLNDLTKKLISGAVSKRISSICSKVFPLHDVFVRKVKVLKRPKFDISKLMEVHDGAAMELPGDKVAREEEAKAAEASQEKGLEGAGGRL